MAGTIICDTLNTATPASGPGSVLTTNNAYNGIAKAWVQYNTSTGAIAGSFNVSSITLGSTGYTIVNFTTAMPNTNYAFNISATGDGQVGVVFVTGTKSAAVLTTSLAVSTAYWTGSSFAVSNVSAACISIFSS